MSGRGGSRAVLNSVVVEVVIFLILLGALFSYIFPIKTVEGYRKLSQGATCVALELDNNGQVIIEERRSFHVLGGQLDDFNRESMDVDSFSDTSCGKGQTVQYKLFL
jgi:hypothetical protein